MIQIQKFLLGAFAIFSLLVLTSCSESQDEDIWIVGTSADNPPYEFINNGKIVGFDIDLATEIAAHLGKRVQFKNMEFHSLLAALGTSNVDMVVAAMSITKERKARVKFSEPYTSAKIALLFRKQSKIVELADVEDKKIGAQLGTIWSIVAHNMAVNYKSKVVSLSSNLALVEELKTHRLDGVVLEVLQAEKFVQSNPSLDFIKIKDYGSSFAIALPKNSSLKGSIDHAIKKLHAKGVIAKLEKKWGIISEN